MIMTLPKAKIDEVKRYTKELLNPKYVDNALYAVAQGGIYIIQTKASQGEGYKGNFKPYTRQYAAWKRRRGNVFSSPNLELEGDMMRDMQPKRGRGQSEIYFREPESARKAVWNNRTRPFFGFSSKSREKLVKEFTKSYLAQVNKAR